MRSLVLFAGISLPALAAAQTGAAPTPSGSTPSSADVVPDGSPSLSPPNPDGPPPLPSGTPATSSAPPADSAPVAATTPSAQPRPAPLIPAGAGPGGPAQAKAAAASVAAAATERVEQAKGQAVDDLLTATRVESQSFRFGLYPNSAGFMDARLHARLHYLKALSSGLYLDYTTARALADDGTRSRADRLVREYRAEADLLKGILLVLRRQAAAWSVEPGVNAQFIHQKIDESGFTTNAFDETVFANSTLRVSQLAGAAKLESTLVLFRTLRLDAGAQYMPWIYQLEHGRTVTSQFEEPVTFSLHNSTRGYQLQGELAWDAGGAGEFTARGLIYRSRGDTASRSSLVSGNFAYTFETFSEARRYDSWVELVHTASYLTWFGNLVPAVAVAFQRKRIETAQDALKADTYKAGFLLEYR